MFPRNRILLLLILVPTGVLVTPLAPLLSAEDSGEIAIFLPDNPKFAAYMLKIQPNDKLVRIKRSEPVYVALLGRHGIDVKYRREAIERLAQLCATSQLEQLLAAIDQIDADGVTKDPEDESHQEPTEDQLSEVIVELARMLTDIDAKELSPERGKFQQLATKASHSATRTLGFVALVTSDGTADQAWATAAGGGHLPELLDGLAMIRDERVRDAVYDRIMALLTEAPDEAVRRAAIRAVVNLPGHDEQVFATLAGLVRDDVARDTAIAALSRIDASRWPAEHIKPLADSITTYIAGAPPNERTRGPVSHAVDLVGRLAMALPATESAEVTSALDDLRVQVIVIRTILENMEYDKKVLVVKAGKPLEIELRNEDGMPHNLVVTSPGALEQVGMAAEAMSTQPDAIAKHFIPDMDQVLHAIDGLRADEVGRLSFTAPQETGVYPYVCTFPGHWRRMYGAMIVVEDVEQYLATNRLPSAEELLGMPQIVNDWKLENLLPALDQMTLGRSFENGAQLFVKASCVSCHRMQGKGGQVGPELTEVSKKYKPNEILREMVEPSRVVDKKFASVIIETEQGKIVRGVVVKEDDQQICLKENPLLSCEPTIVKKDDIDHMDLSNVSPMPVGLLNILRKDEILDLLAYVVAGGNARHSTYQQ